MTEQVVFKNAKFITADDFSLPYKSAAELNRLFSLDFIKKNAAALSFKGGRGQTALFSLSGEDLVLRQYLRGGLWGKLMHDKFFIASHDAHRAFDEFILLGKLKAKGLPVPEPVAAKEEKSGLFLRNYIIIKQIKNCADLSYVIKNRHLSADEFIRIGSTLKRFFDEGVLHTDLNIRNILLDNKGDVYVIDFDKCKIIDLGRQDKEAMLARLLRSFNKEVRITANAAYFKESDFALLKEAALAD